MPEFMMAVMLLIAVFLVSRQAVDDGSGQAVAVGARRPVVVLTVVMVEMILKDRRDGSLKRRSIWVDRTSPEKLSEASGQNGGHD